MGEDLARGHTRTSLRRWALLAVVAVATVAAAIVAVGGVRATQPRVVGTPYTAAASIGSELHASPIVALRDQAVVTSAPPVEQTTTTLVDVTAAATPAATATATPGVAVPTTPAQAPAPAPAPVEVATAPVVDRPTPAAPEPPTELAGWTRRTDIESELFARHNEARVAAGLAAYSEQPCLTSVAVRWARTMAEQNMLAHNPDYGRQIQQCSDDITMGENVGMGYGDGANAATVFDKFMASPTHRSNILATDFQMMGIGVWSGPDGTIRVAVNFGLR
jgi:uncharacterized protein YkwD